MAIHPEDALFNAGASNGYYEIVGASYAPADTAAGTPALSTIDLSTMDQTGCLLTHDHAAGKTTLKWDSVFPSSEMYGTDDDVQMAVDDITHCELDHKALFAAFQAQMTAETAP